jgi:hypothetical protein
MSGSAASHLSSSPPGSVSGVPSPRQQGIAFSGQTFSILCHRHPALVPKSGAWDSSLTHRGFLETRSKRAQRCLPPEAPPTGGAKQERAAGEDCACQFQEANPKSRSGDTGAIMLGWPCQPHAGRASCALRRPRSPPPALSILHSALQREPPFVAQVWLRMHNYSEEMPVESQTPLCQYRPMHVETKN